MLVARKEPPPDDIQPNVSQSFVRAVYIKQDDLSEGMIRQYLIKRGDHGWVAHSFVVHVSTLSGEIFDVPMALAANAPGVPALKKTIQCINGTVAGCQRLYKCDDSDGEGDIEESGKELDDDYCLGEECSVLLCVGIKRIIIKIEDQTGEKMYFELQMNTKMGKVFAKYAQLKGVHATSLRYLFDGQNIGNMPNQTVEMWELEDQDEIDCLLEQGSDRSIKSDITRVGTSAAGIPEYTSR